MAQCGVAELANHFVVLLLGVQIIDDALLAGRQPPKSRVAHAQRTRQDFALDAVDDVGAPLAELEDVPATSARLYRIVQVRRLRRDA